MKHLPPAGVDKWRALRLPALIALGFFCLVMLPFLVGSLGVPRGMGFTGTLKALGDESVYMSAIRQGQQGIWLWHDQYMVHTPAPIAAYLSYIAFGHAGGLVGLSVRTTYALMHGVAAMVLAWALWVLGSAYLNRRQCAWLVAFAIGTSGLYWLDALFALAGRAPAVLSWMAMPPLGGLTSALMGAHETLGAAGQVMVLAAVLGVLREGGLFRWRAALYGALGTALVGVTLPMLLPVTMSASAILVVRYIRQAGTSVKRLAAFNRALLGVGIILLPGVAVACYYYWELVYGAWSAGPLTAMGSRPLAESLLVWGAVLPLGLWGWLSASTQMRPLADAMAAWCCCALAGLAIPFWQGFRFSNGLNIMLGGLLALAVLRPRITPRWRMRILLLAALGGLVHLVFLLSLLGSGEATTLYISAPQEQAMDWLAAHTGERDVVLAPLGFSNQLPEVASCRLVAGHGLMTFDMPLRDRQLHLFYSSGTGVPVRLQVLRATTADYVVYDSQDGEDGTYDPRGLPGLRGVFSNSQVTIFATPATP